MLRDETAGTTANRGNDWGPVGVLPRAKAMADHAADAEWNVFGISPESSRIRSCGVYYRVNRF